MTETGLRANVYLVHPRAESLHLERIGQGATLALHLHPGHHAYVMLGGPGADREADAKAMERLAELASEAAAKLREPRPVQPT